MASVMALVSKGVFERDAVVGGRLLALGDVWATNAYVSKSRALTALADGGDLYLVTVRPPREELWLVAVLRGPHFDGSQWTAEPNAVAATAIDELVPRWTFSTGKGLTPKPGKLGMSLQSPRKLTDNDVALFESAIGNRQEDDEPPRDEPASSGEPPNATHRDEQTAEASPRIQAKQRLLALAGDEAVLAELEAAEERCDTAPARCAKIFKNTARSLGQTDTALAVLAWGAEVLLDAGNAKGAKTLFNAANTLEGKLDADVGQRQRMETWARFAAGGCIERKKLVRYLKTLAKTGDTNLADALQHLMVRWVAGAGDYDDPYGASYKLIETGTGIVTKDVHTALTRIGKAWGDPNLPHRIAVELLPLSRRAEAEFYLSSKEAILAELRRDRRAATRAFQLWPSGDTAGWRALLNEAGFFDHLEQLEQKEAIATLGRAIAWQYSRLWDAEHLAWLEACVVRLAPAIERPLTLREVAGDDSNGPDPDLLDMLVQHGLDLVVGEYGDINFYQWPDRECRRPLSNLAEAGALADHFVDKARHYLLVGKKMSLLVAAIDNPLLRRALDERVDEFCDLVDNGTVADFVEKSGALAKMLVGPVVAAIPELSQAVRRLDTAVMLRNTFRLGIMDEWHWPLQDEVSDQIGQDAGQFDIDGPFPYYVMHFDDAARLVVLGPDGVVMNVKRPQGWPDYARTMRYVDGDILFFNLDSNLRIGRWLSAPDDTFKMELYGSMRIGHFVEGGHSEGGAPFLAGSKTIDGRRSGTLFTDGNRAFRGREAFDPATGKKAKGDLFAWLTELEDEQTTLSTGACSYYPVPASCSASPLGLREGQYGFRTYVRDDGTTIGESIDGRRYEGDRKRGLPHAIISFPSRNTDVVALHTRANDFTLCTLDNRRTLISAVHGGLARHWAGAPQYLPIPWWHYLVPRDEAGSRALASCSTEACRTLIDAALGVGSEDQTSVHVTDKVTATLQTAPTKRGERIDAALAAVADAFPGVTAPRLRRGMASIAAVAAGHEEQITMWRNALGVVDETIDYDGLDDRDGLILNDLFGVGWSNGDTDLEASIRGSAAWLTADEQTEEFGTGSLLTGSRLAWDGLLAQLGGSVWLAMAAGASKFRSEQLTDILTVFADTPYAATPDRFRLLSCTFDAPPPGASHTRADIGVTWDRRYVLRTRTWSKHNYGFATIEYAPDGHFVDPPGTTVNWEIRPEQRWHGVQPLTAALQLRRERGAIPVSEEIAKRISDITGLTVAGGGLLWAGCLPGRKVDASVRKAIKCRVADIELGLKEIAPVDVELYTKAMPGDPAALYEPLADDGSGVCPVDRLANEWVARHGERKPLDVDLVHRLEADFHTRTEQFHLDVRVFDEPESYEFLTHDVAWAVRPWRGFQSSVSYMRGSIPPGWPQHAGDGAQAGAPNIEAAFSGWVLRHFLRFVPWAHLELPAGSRHRRGLAKMVELIEARLANPDLLLLGGAVDLSEETDPDVLQRQFDDILATFSGEPYSSPDSSDVAEGLDRGDYVVTWPKDVQNSFFVSVRPANVTDPATFAKMATDLGFYDVFRRSGGGCTCGLNFGSYKVVDITELPWWLIWRSEGFQRVAARLNASDLPDESFEADPGVSVPHLVDAVRVKHDVSDASARLFLQMLTLPEPTDDRIRRYNGWRKAEHKQASKPLLDRGLLEEKKHDGTQRKLFVAGSDLARPTQPAAPLEESKLALYGLEPDVKGKIRPTFGVVLPTRPLAELFEQAWQQAHS